MMLKWFSFQVWDEFERVCDGPRRDSARRALGHIFREVGARFFTSEGTLPAIVVLNSILIQMEAKAEE